MTGNVIRRQPLSIIRGLTLTGGDASGDGGAILARETLSVVSTTITGNSTDSHGGGIYASGNLTVTSSTITRNSAVRNGEYYGNDGGIGASRDVTVVSSTISGNNGSGIRAKGEVTVASSTISGNYGGGIYSSFSPYVTTTIRNSIVAANTSGIERDPQDLASWGTFTVDYSLIGYSWGSLGEAPIGSPDANGNLVGGHIHGVIDPLLAPLADHGGPTWTHALLPGSPAIDMGDPDALPGVGETPVYDQRGWPSTRIFAGRIDIGAYELQTASSADFNDNGLIDGLDFLAWQRGAGIPSGEAHVDGDADGDGDVDLDDWQFGRWASASSLAPTRPTAMHVWKTKTLAN